MTLSPFTSFLSRLSRQLRLHWDTIVLSLGFLALYVATLSPGLQPADSGEFQAVVPLLGVAHPPGFSLYILMGRVFISLVRVGGYAYRLNLYSAVTSAASLALVNLSVRRLVWREGAPGLERLLQYLPGWLAAALLGLSTTFWSQATTTNIRSLMALLTALAVWALVGLRLRPSPGRLALFFFSLSLAVVHHLSIAFIAAVLAAAALVFARTVLTRRSLGLAILAGLAPLAVLLYLPIRGAQGAFLAPPGLNTLNGFLAHALGLGFGGDFFYFASPVYWPDRFPILLNVFQFQFNDLALIVLAAGLVLFFWRDAPLALALTLAFAAHCFIAITYRAPQTVEYLLPAYVILAVAAGAGLAQAAERLAAAPSRLRAAPALALYLSLAAAGAAVGLRNYPAYAALAADDSLTADLTGALQAAPPKALILAAWHQAAPLWYLQYITGLRPDVDVEYVYPQGTSLAQNWLDRIKANAATRPTLVTAYYPVEYAGLPYQFLPILTYQPLWLASPEPMSGDPALPTHAGGWALTSASAIDSGAGTDRLAGNQSLAVQTFWQAPASPQAINFFVQLIGPDGLLYGQADVAHPAATVAPHELVSDRLWLAVDPAAPAGDGYSLVAGAYTPDGQRLACLPSLNCLPDNLMLIKHVSVVPLAAPAATRHAQPFGLLAGYDLDRSLPDSPRLYFHWRLDGAPHEVNVSADGGSAQTVSLPAGPGYLTTALDLPADWQSVSVSGGANARLDRAAFAETDRYVSFGPLTLVGSSITNEGGGSFRVDLDWLANRPLSDDLVVKVDLVGPGYAWRDQSDSVPAGGAIPTLKWIPGIVIHDRHRLRLLGAGPAQFQLAVYDHFTLRSLPILDARLAQLGPTVPLGETQP